LSETNHTSSVISTVALPEGVEGEIRSRFRFSNLSLRSLGPARFLALLGEPDALIVAPGDRIDADLIDGLPSSLRVIASYSVGLDHVDFGAAERRGIVVANTPGVLTDATADVAVMLILMTVRCAPRAMAELRDGKWAGWSPDHIFGRDLAGLTLGIAGPGAIGLATAQRAKAFGMTVAYWGRRRAEAFDAMAARYLPDWDEFAASVDVLSLHVPSTEATRNLVDARTISRLRGGAVLINTARGDLIDDDAVLAALASGKLAGVGLDVIRGEPAIDPRWLSAPNCVLLPHIGSATIETREAMGRIVIANIDRHLIGT
jgi:lactate dehydrogenase-like 2-hydroxyacid dehydrogenase